MPRLMLLSVLLAYNFMTVCLSQWVEINNPLLPYAGQRMAVGSYNNTLFILGSNTSPRQMTEYKIQENKMKDRGSSYLSEDMQGTGQYWTQLLNTIYMISDTGSKISTYDMQTKTFLFQWESLPTQVGTGGCLASTATHFFISGGHVSSFLDTMQILRLSDNEWSSGPTLKHPRRSGACIVVNGALYLIGGKDGGGEIATIEKIVNVTDMQLQQWQIRDPLTRTSGGCRVVSPFPNTIWAIGGYGPPHRAEVWKIDTTDDSVSVHSYLPYPAGGTAAIVDEQTRIVFVLAGVNTGTNLDTWAKYQLPTTTTSTSLPTAIPTEASNMPTSAPTKMPSVSPSNDPTASPSRAPSKDPTTAPSRSPSDEPTVAPSISTIAPSSSTAQPSVSPSSAPSGSSNAPFAQPTIAPSVSPTDQTGAPSEGPSVSPSNMPSTAPSKQPSASPTLPPSEPPSASPTPSPSKQPSASPTFPPSKQPSASPSSEPTPAPSLPPSNVPSQQPSVSPTNLPTVTTFDSQPIETEIGEQLNDTNPLSTTMISIIISVVSVTCCISLLCIVVCVYFCTGKQLKNFKETVEIIGDDASPGNPQQETNDMGNDVHDVELASGSEDNAQDDKAIRVVTDHEDEEAVVPNEDAPGASPRASAEEAQPEAHAKGDTVYEIEGLSDEMASTATAGAHVMDAFADKVGISADKFVAAGLNEPQQVIELVQKGRTGLLLDAKVLTVWDVHCLTEYIEKEYGNATADGGDWRPTLGATDSGAMPHDDGDI